MAVPDIAAKRVKKVPTQYLEFDPDNPRLVEDGIKNPDESDIILALADMADLSEVVQSIASNGYFDIEPLIGQRVSNKWRVLEGNRRLAAIRILQNPALSPKAPVFRSPKSARKHGDAEGSLRLRGEQ